MQNAPSIIKLALGGVLVLGAFSMVSKGFGTSDMPNMVSQEPNSSAIAVSTEIVAAESSVSQQSSDREPVPGSEAMISIIEGATDVQVERIFVSRFNDYRPTEPDDMDAQYVNVEVSMSLENESDRWEFKATLKHTINGWVLYAPIE